MTSSDHDILVIGGGVAGVSVAYELAAGGADVCVVEMESAFGVHSTGRSAAVFIESYGNAPIRALTSASREEFVNPGQLFDRPMGTPLSLLHTARAGRSPVLRDLYAEASPRNPGLVLLEGSEAERLNPVLRPGTTELALLDPGVLDLDVDGLHQGYLRGLRARGGLAVRSAQVVRAQREAGCWTVSTSDDETFTAPIVVNAAGAWCDRVGQVFGADPIGIEPLRRSIFIVDAPAGVEVGGIPMTLDADEEFYLKSEGDRLLCSPADETPQPPGSPRPDELEIARAIEEIAAMTILDIRSVRQSWAGLRSFVADRTPVVGCDPAVEGFYWFAGQGGYGIQTCPALARTGASIIRGDALPNDVVELGLTAQMLSPERLS